MFQVTAMFGKQQPGENQGNNDIKTAEPAVRKISFRSDRAMPSFQETDEATSPEGQQNCLNSQEIPCKKSDSSSSEPIKIRKQCDSSHPNNSDPIPSIKSDLSSVASDPITITKCAIDNSVDNLSPGILFVNITIY